MAFYVFLVFCVGRPVRADEKARNVEPDWDRVGAKFCLRKFVYYF